MKNQRPFLDMDFMGYQQKIFNRTGKVPTRKEYLEHKAAREYAQLYLGDGKRGYDEKTTE